MAKKYGHQMQAKLWTDKVSHSYIANGNAIWYRYSAKQFGNFFEN